MPLFLESSVTVDNFDKTENAHKFKPPVRVESETEGLEYA
jgi:hypothetical protein